NRAEVAGGGESHRPGPAAANASCSTCLPPAAYQSDRRAAHYRHEIGSSNPPYRLGPPTVAASTTWTLKAAVPAANRVASGLDVDNTAPTSPARYVPQKARREHGRGPNSSANGTYAGSGRNRRVSGDG